MIDALERLSRDLRDHLSTVATIDTASDEIIIAKLNAVGNLAQAIAQVNMLILESYRDDSESRGPDICNEKVPLTQAEQDNKIRLENAEEERKQELKNKDRERQERERNEAYEKSEAGRYHSIRHGR